MRKYKYLATHHFLFTVDHSAVWVIKPSYASTQCQGPLISVCVQAGSEALRSCHSVHGQVFILKLNIFAMYWERVDQQRWWSCVEEVVAETAEIMLQSSNHQIS